MDGHRFGARHLLVVGVLGVAVVAATLTVEGVGNTASPPPTKHPAAQSAISLDPDGYPNRTRGLSSNGSRTVPPAGANGVVAVSGAVQTAMPFLEYMATFSGSASRATWTGTLPSTPDSIDLTDVWRVDFVGTGYIVVNPPPGAAVQLDPAFAQVTWTTTVQAAATGEHDWSQLFFFPETPPQYGQIFRLRHEVTATFHFGSNAYTVTTVASSFT